MSGKSYLLVISIAAFLPGSNLVSAEEKTPVPTGKVKAPFDIKKLKQFVDSDLSRPKPGCSMADMGIPGRRVEGQLVDHAGKPMADVAVAIVEPIGYSRHCYYDNFDFTDQQGRFVVDASVAKTRLIFRKSDGKIWPVKLMPDQSLLRVTWPEPATVTVHVPESMAMPGQTITLQTSRYWSGMSLLRVSAELDDEGTAVFEDVIPNEYHVATNQSIEVIGKSVTRPIGIATFTLEPGQKKTVQCQESGTTITGNYVVIPSPAGANFAHYVLIERNQTGYTDQPPAGDILRLEKDGNFTSRPLAPGHYTVKVMAKGLAPARSFRGMGGDRPVQTWLVYVSGQSAKIALELLPDPDPVEVEVTRALQATSRQTGGNRGNYQAKQLKESQNRSDAERILIERLKDADYPYPLRRAIPDLLKWMTDSPQVVAGLLEAIKEPPQARERGDMIRTLGGSEHSVDEIVRALAPYQDDSNHIIRSITARALGDLAVKHPDHASEIAKLLVRALDDSWEATRSTAADYLGRIGSTDALPALLKTADDTYGPVAVMAAYSAWRISGDPESVYPTMTGVLGRKGIAGMWEAAYFMKSVAEKHPIPEETLGVLRRVATMAGKPPFKSSFEYEQSRAAGAAQQVLDQIAEAGGD